MALFWYRIANENEFLELGIPSKEYEYVFDNIGLRTATMYSGRFTCLSFEGIFLPVELNGLNPYQLEDYAIYKDDNSDIWLGVEFPE
jgi:hypothetical protein